MPTITLAQAMQLATQHYKAGRLADAENVLRQMLAQQPEHPDALNLMGVMARRAGDPDAAIAWLRRAIAAQPSAAAYHGNLGNALRDKGLLDEAIAVFRHCVTAQPQVAGHYNNLGIALFDKGNCAEAVAAYQRAIELQPNYADPYANLALVLTAQNQLEEAVAAYRKALQLRPDHIETRNNLAKCLCDLGQFDEAVEMLRACLATDPLNSACHSNMGNALSDGLRLDEAIAAYRRAIEIDPNYADAHGNLALALLLQGNFQEGWPEYEWRWKCNWSTQPRQFMLYLPSNYTAWPSDWSARPRQFARPQWAGPGHADLAGRTLLLHAEQGYGDVIQFVRYAPRVAALGARVLLLCWPPLARLLSHAPGISEVVPAAPSFDEHLPLLSLPLVFGTTLETIPAAVPYLHADPQLAAGFAAKVPSAGLKVGLAWAGNSAHKHDRQRSITLAQLAPLASVPGTTFYSLQKGPAGTQSANPPPGMNLVDLTGELRDFADTAALLSHLDLVIAVDTAVAHLAGAMGKPVWLLLPYAPDWRWQLQRADSPWYPTARLFRQSTPCQWQPVIERVAHSLAHFQPTPPAPP